MSDAMGHVATVTPGCSCNLDSDIANQPSTSGFTSTASEKVSSSRWKAMETTPSDISLFVIPFYLNHVDENGKSVELIRWSYLFEYDCRESFYGDPIGKLWNSLRFRIGLMTVKHIVPRRKTLRIAYQKGRQGPKIAVEQQKDLKEIMLGLDLGKFVSINVDPVQLEITVVDVEEPKLCCAECGNIITTRVYYECTQCIDFNMCKSCNEADKHMEHNVVRKMNSVLEENATPIRAGDSSATSPPTSLPVLPPPMPSISSSAASPAPPPPPPPLAQSSTPPSPSLEKPRTGAPSTPISGEVLQVPPPPTPTPGRAERIVDHPQPSVRNVREPTLTTGSGNPNQEKGDLVSQIAAFKRETLRKVRKSGIKHAAASSHFSPMEQRIVSRRSAIDPNDELTSRSLPTVSRGIHQLTDQFRQNDERSSSDLDSSDWDNERSQRMK